MSDTIILIGPIGSGKTTVAEILARRLGRPQVSMDLERYAYYEEIGYDEALAQRKFEQGGWWARYRYWKPFEAHAVERILADHPGAVIDFGAGHSVYEDQQLFAQVAEVMAPYPNIFLLLPAEEVGESLRILNDREQHSSLLLEINRHFLEHHSNYDLAKWIIYTGEMAPEAVGEEILKRLQNQDPAVAFNPKKM